jgi:uncharacterized protein (TIGR02145 family)
MFNFLWRNKKDKKSENEKNHELEKIEIEKQKFNLEQQRFKQELRRSRYATIVALTIAGLGFATNAWVSKRNAEAQNFIAEKKAEADRILEVMKIKDYDAQAVNIKFLISAGLIKIYKDQMLAYVVKRLPGTGVSLLMSDTANLELSRSWNLTEIGDEIWTARNLDVDRYNDGSPIPEAHNMIEWQNFNKLNEGCWTYYITDTGVITEYGKIYNWYAINNDRGLVPVGWHIPSCDEAKKINYDYHFSASDLKSKTGWAKDTLTGNQGSGSDTTKFNALPGGYCTDNFEFKEMGREGRWWTSSPRKKGPDKDSIYFFYMYSESNVFQWDPMIKSYGHYIRCVKDNLIP